jgi:hypothetical protein
MTKDFKPYNAGVFTFIQYETIEGYIEMAN